MPAACGGRDEAFTAETPSTQGVLVVVRKMFTTENAESTEAFVFHGRLWTDPLKCEMSGTLRLRSDDKAISRGDARPAPQARVPGRLVLLEHAGLAWGAEADQPVDGVGRALRGGVVVADLKFAEQADGQHLDAA